jgi:hypothetical protein
MEGLRLLDESQRDGGSTDPMEEPAASANTSSGGSSSMSTPSAIGRADEEEDVLLDN